MSGLRSALRQKAGSKSRYLNVSVEDDDPPVSTAESSLDFSDLFGSVGLIAQFPALQSALAKIAIFANYAPGQEIVGQAPSTASLGLIVIVSGTATLSTNDKDQVNLTRGQYCGECQLFGLDEAWADKLVAKTHCKVLKLTRSNFLRSIEAFPAEANFYKSLLAMHMKGKAGGADGAIYHACEILKIFGEPAQHALNAAMRRRMYGPGEVIAKQGDEESHLCILLQGAVSVEVGDMPVRHVKRGEALPLQRTVVSRRDRIEVFDAADPICFGELGLLGMQSFRSFSLVAESVCQVRLLYRESFAEIANAHGLDVLKGISASNSSSDDVASPSSAASQASDRHVLREVALFKEVGFKVEFLDFLARHLEDVVFFCGQTICEQGASKDRSLYISVSGVAKVLVDGVQKETTTYGACYGHLMVLGFVLKRAETLIATEFCYMQRLSQTVVVNALRCFPEERKKLEKVGLKRCEGSFDNADEDEMKLVVRAMKSSPIFAELSEAFIRDLGAVARRRVFMPGDVIAEQGCTSKSLFITILGQAAVQCSSCDTSSEACSQSALEDGDVAKDSGVTIMGVISAGSITGEMSMLGIMQKSPASIEAMTICCLWEIDYDSVMPLINEFPDVQEVFADIIKRRLMHTVQPLVDSLSLFKDFDPRFRSLLSLYSERRVYFPNQTIFRENEVGEGLITITLGTVLLQRSSVTIGNYSDGSFFNAVVMLNLSKVNYCTLTALDTCHLVLISNDSYYLALTQHPSQKSAKILERNELELADQFRNYVRRLCVHKVLDHRAALAEVSPGLHVNMSNFTLKRLCVKCWRQMSKSSALSRSVREQQDKGTARWIQRYKEAAAKRLANQADRLSPDRSVSSDIAKQATLTTPTASVNSDGIRATSLPRKVTPMEGTGERAVVSGGSTKSSSKACALPRLYQDKLEVAACLYKPITARYISMETRVRTPRISAR